jgi:hypothetical protein
MSIIDIVISIIVGIFTYLIIQALVRFFNDTVIPWYQSIIYGGRNIEGTWYGYQAELEGGDYFPEKESRSTIYLTQKGNKITGELLLTKQSSGEKCRKLFILNGFFNDNVLILEQEVKDKTNMGIGNSLMKLTEGGEKLKGRHTYISSANWSTIFSIDEVWIRKK